MGKLKQKILITLQIALLAISTLAYQIVSAQEEAVCAVVKIEILQELTLERQAFEAELQIENTLEGKNLENIDINVNFIDENNEPVVATNDPNNTEAKFFIRVQSKDNIADVDGSGVIAGGETATVKWLIIPAPGAAGGRERGTLYFVGADFNYSLEGADDTISVAPDNIYVKPMPLLTLDYFIPRDVFGDDPFTSAIEPLEPFTLGVRVQNNGTGVAKSLKIDSAQPKIIENENGLLINFELLSSFVADNPVANTLLLDFGDIAASSAKVGRWLMQVSLNGEFTEFGATFTHADELGGALTSLLEATNTHFLIRDVVVDLPGRDEIRDFLAEDQALGLESPSVFESEGTIASVVNQSSASSELVFDQDIGALERYILTVPQTAGLFFVRKSDPLLGNKQLAYVERSDGKRLNPQNAWLSKVQNKVSNDYTYSVNLFDSFGTDTYYFYYQVAEIIPMPPVIQFIPLRTTSEGEQISFIVEASDPDGNTVTLSTGGTEPAGASFTDNGNGTANFTWTPSVGQAGNYAITYQANDGTQTAFRTATIVVNSGDDTDGDGLSDAWEMANFGNLDQDATGDFDGDGISNADEFANGTNPDDVNGPPVPTIFMPAIGSEVSELQVNLSVTNGSYEGPHADNLSYQFQLSTDDDYSTQVAVYNAVPWDNNGTSSWVFDLELLDNTTYYWRARSYDGFTYSLWANASFFTNTANDLPTQPALSAPSDGGDLQGDNPILEVSNSTDPDQDNLFYEFFVYSDLTLETLVATSGVIAEDVSGMTSWIVDSPLTGGETYFWQVRVTDENSASVLSDTFTFNWVDGNRAPPAPVLISPVDEFESDSRSVTFVASTVVDPDGDVLTYTFQGDELNTFDSPSVVEIEVEVDPNSDTQSLFINSLRENLFVYWRVKASDSEFAESPWSESHSLFVNSINEAPNVPVVNNPGNGATIDSINPVLQLFEVVDVDLDVLQYEFEIYADDELTDLVVTEIIATPEFNAPTLSDNTTYYWRARAFDEDGLYSTGSLPDANPEGWTSTNSFYVNDNSFDDPPRFTWIAPTEKVVTEEDTSVELLWDDLDADSSALINLYYADNVLGNNPQNIVNDLSEDADGAADSYTWDLTSIEPGNYYVFAEIRDETTQVVQEALAVVEITPTLVVPGNIVINNQSTLELYEAYADPVSTSFSVSLDKAPSANVIVPISNPNSERFSLSTSSLIFTPDNWMDDQTVELTAINNCLIDETSSLAVTLDAAESNDPAFNNVNGGQVSVIVYNDDTNLFSNMSNASSTNYAMCGIKTVDSSIVNGRFAYTFEIYIQNIGTEQHASIDLQIALANGSPVGPILEYASMPVSTIRTHTNEFDITLGTAVENNWIDPSIYNLQINNILEAITPVGDGNLVLNIAAPIELYEAYANPVSSTLSISLDRAPTANVTVPVSNITNNRFSINTQSLVFTPQNWMIPQDVELVPINNCTIDTEEAYALTIGTTSSSDPVFNNLTELQVPVTVYNDDTVVRDFGSQVPSASYVMCGLERTSVVESGSSYTYTYKMYLKNISSTPLGSFEVAILLPNGSTFGTELFFNSIPQGSIGTHGNNISLTSANALTNEWVDPDRFTLRIQPFL